MINYGKQHIDSDDIKAVIKVLRGDWITQGRQIEKFESALKFKFGAKFCKVLSNGTAALHLAGLALGWKKGDIILTTPISFLSTANCILYSGATPDFVDINNYSYNIDPNKLADKIKNLNFRSNKVVAIVATDYAGYPCDWKAIKSISRKYDVKLINDNSHALGASYNNDTQYAAKYADIVTHSYHPVKHITTGEGGAILTNSKTIDEKVHSLRSHGIIKDFKKKKVNNGGWYYEMRELGFNYRITDFQCALGLNQLKRLSKFLKRRRKIAAIYNSEFKNKNIFTIPKIKKNYKHAFHLYPLRISFEKLKISKKELFKKLSDVKINLQVHYIPIHLQPFYRKRFGFKSGDFPIAEKFYRDEISLPIYSSLKNKQVYSIIKYLNKFITTDKK